MGRFFELEVSVVFIPRLKLMGLSLGIHLFSFYSIVGCYTTSF